MYFGKFDFQVSQAQQRLNWALAGLAGANRNNKGYPGPLSFSPPNLQSSSHHAPPLLHGRQAQTATGWIA